MSEIQITGERHLIYFDDNKSITSIYTLKVSQSASNQPALEPTQDDKQFTFTFPPQQEPLKFQIWSQFSYTWSFQSDFLTCKELKNAPHYGTIPFSLETYIELYQDLRLHKFLFQTKPGVSKEKLGTHQVIGRITFKTRFKNNPFIFPLRVVNSEASKKISIVVPEDEVAVCSGELLDMVEAEEVQGFVSKKNQWKYLRIYNYGVSGITDAKIICVMKGRFETKKMTIQGAEINLMVPQGSEIQNLSVFKDAFVRLFGVMKPKNMIVIRGVETKIECAEGIMFWPKNCLNLFQRIFRTQLLSKIKDEWIIEGMITYQNNYRHFHSKFSELCDLVKKGQQFSPLIEDQYCMDEVWKLKATVMYHIFTQLTHQEQKLTHALISSIKQDRKMNTESFYRTIKNKYGIASLNQYNQFIKFTGITKFSYQFSYTKKENKVKVRIRQKPLQSKNYQAYNSFRMKLEESFDVRSSLIVKIVEKNERITGKDSMKKKEPMGPLLVPTVLKSNTFVKGKIPIILAETNETEVREQNFNIKINKKKVNKENLNCRNKLRKTINKKGGVERELGSQSSWMKLDPTQTYMFFYFNQNVDSVKLLKQLTWEENEMELFRLLQYTRNTKDTAVIDRLCQMLEIKETNRTSLAVRQQVLNVFHAVLGNSEDRKPWDTLLALLRLYQPPFYDRSLDGHHFKLSLIDCVSKLKMKDKYIDYFEEFHRIMLGMSRDNEVLFPGKQEVEFRKTLYRGLLSWRTKHTLQILGQVNQITAIYLFKQDNYGILKAIVEKVFSHDFFIQTDEMEFIKFKELKKTLMEAMRSDRSNKLELIEFNNTIYKAEIDKSPLEFFIFMYYKLEEISMEKPQIYVQCLKIVKNILAKNKKKYALDYQINVFNVNQNYFIAERLWEKMTTGESLYIPSVRLQWMKIYRVFYFYFTPVSVIHKIKYDKDDDPFRLPFSKEDRLEILDNIKDFTPDIDWFSGYDITNKKHQSLKQQDREQIDRLKQKKIRLRNDVALESTKFIARKVKENPDKEVNWQELSKYMLDMLIAKHENKRTKMEVINQLKGVKKKLKRGHTPKWYTFEKLQDECWKALEEGEQETETLGELIRQIKETLQRVVIKQSDTKFILPIDVLK